jgi:hypothetical protein
MSLGVKFFFIFTTLAACQLAWSQASDTQAAAPATSSDQTAPAAAPAPAPTPSTSLSASGARIGGVDISGSVDGFFVFNNNHPDTGVNQLVEFNDKANQVDLNFAKLTLSHDPGPIGFRVDVGFGRVEAVSKTPRPDPEAYRFIEQSYISLKPKSMKGFEADFGEFTTSAGAEVIETKDNWNYSRSILFAWALPYYHFGIRTSMPVTSSLTVGAQLVNGWNAIVNQYGNNMKTGGLTAAWAKKMFTWTHNYYVGSDISGFDPLGQSISGTRSLYDTTLLLTPWDRMNAYINFDYGRQNLATGSNHWMGMAGAVHVQLSKRFAVTPRVEFYDDHDGFTTGTAQNLHEITVTGECKIFDGLVSRLEYRHDGSDQAFFRRGSTDYAKTENTVTLGMIAYFPFKH